MDLEWPNPRQYKRKESLELAYTAKYYEAEVAKKVIEYIETARTRVEEIKKKYEIDEEPAI